MWWRMMQIATGSYAAGARRSKAWCEYVESHTRALSGSIRWFVEQNYPDAPKDHYPRIVWREARHEAKAVADALRGEPRWETAGRDPNGKDGETEWLGSSLRFPR